MDKTKFLEQQIHYLFDELSHAQNKFAVSNSFEDWSECISILPKIADRVECLKIEALIAEGKHPLN